MQRIALAAGLAAAAIAVQISVHFSGDERPAPTSHSPAVKQFALDDGSNIQVNADGLIEVAYSTSERRVRLVRGEAHFEVAKDPKRPFLVDIHDVTVRAVGTAFNIRLAPRRVELLVTEGNVKVESSFSGSSLLPEITRADPSTDSNERLLSAGHRALIALDRTLPATLQVETVTPQDVARTLAWRETRLNFEDVTLREAVAEFNRHNRHQLVITDEKIGRMRFGGSFKPDAYPAFVRLLETDFGVSAEHRGDTTILRAAP